LLYKLVDVLFNALTLSEFIFYLLTALTLSALHPATLYSFLSLTDRSHLTMHQTIGLTDYYRMD